MRTVSDILAQIRARKERSNQTNFEHFALEALRLLAEHTLARKRVGQKVTQQHNDRIRELERKVELLEQEKTTQINDQSAAVWDLDYDADRGVYLNRGQN